MHIIAPVCVCERAYVQSCVSVLFMYYIIYRLCLLVSLCFFAPVHGCLCVCVRLGMREQKLARCISNVPCLNVTCKILNYSNPTNYREDACSNMQNIPRPHSSESDTTRHPADTNCPRLPGLHSLRRCHPPAAPSSTTTA